MKNGVYLFSIVCLLNFTFEAQAQFTESFDSGIPLDWTVIDNDGQGTTWSYSTVNTYQGDGAARIPWEEFAHDDYLIAPQFTVTAGISDLVSFYAGGRGSQFTETFDVKLSTTGTSPSDFTVTLGSETTNLDVTVGEYAEYAYNLTAYTGSDVYIAIVATSVDAFQLYVDEFSVSELPACPKPGNLNISGLTASSVILNWSAGGSETEWNIKYGESGFDPVSGGISQAVSGEPNFTLIDLLPGTGYDLYVQSNCGDEDGVSTYAGPLHFFTPCLPANAPFTDGFEDNTVDGIDLGGCYSQQVITGSGWKVNNSITFNNRAPRTGDWNIWLSYGSEAWIFRPFELNAGTTYTLKLYARESNSSGANIVASYGLSNQADDMVEEIIPETEVADGDYQEISGDFTPITSGIYYIGIRGHVNGGFFPVYMAMDDISLQEFVTCAQPSDLILNSITNTSASVSWTPGNTETQWLVKYGEPGFDPLTEGNQLVVNGSPDIILNSLESAHVYSVFVKALCGEEDGNSDYAGPLTLTTPPVNDNVCDAIDLAVGGICDNNYSNIGATIEQDEEPGSCIEFPGNATVWFTFTAPPSGNVTVSTDFEGGTLTDSQLAVYDAPGDCSDLSTLGAEIGCNEDGGEVGDGYLSVVQLTDLSPGNVYYVQVNGYLTFFEGTITGTFCIQVMDDGSGCLAPTGFTITNINDVSADVSWVSVGSETYWEILYGERSKILLLILDTIFISEQIAATMSSVSGLDPNRLLQQI